LLLQIDSFSRIYRLRFSDKLFLIKACSAFVFLPIN